MVPPLPVMTSTKVRPSLWARCKNPMAHGALASASFHPSVRGFDFFSAARQMRALAAPQRRRWAAQAAASLVSVSAEF